MSEMMLNSALVYMIILCIITFIALMISVFLSENRKGELMKLEDLTIKEMCSCLAILNKMQQEGIVDVDLETTTATFNTDKATEYLEKENEELQQRIDKAIEYIENNSLYETEYDYDYEENSYLSGIDDEIAKKDLLEILKGED